MRDRIISLLPILIPFRTEQNNRAPVLAERVKNLPAMQETWIRSLGWKNLLEKGVATHSCILAWKISWTEEPDGLQSMGSQRIRHDGLTNTFTFHFQNNRTKKKKKNYNSSYNSSDLVNILKKGRKGGRWGGRKEMLLYISNCWLGSSFPQTPKWCCADLTSNSQACSTSTLCI